jgi:hypothetical protein
MRSGALFHRSLHFVYDEFGHRIDFRLPSPAFSQFPTHELMAVSSSLQQFYLSKLAVRTGGIRHIFILESRLGQGGPMYVTPLHVAARLGDGEMCKILLKANASVNANIFLPNDQHSHDKSPAAANKADGSDWSQYRWGMITPMRMALTFGHKAACAVLQEHAGQPGGTIHTRLPRGGLIGGYFARAGRPGFETLPDGTCWTNSDETAIFALNVYMKGDRVYPETLYDRSICQQARARDMRVSRNTLRS